MKSDMGQGVKKQERTMSRPLRGGPSSYVSATGTTSAYYFNNPTNGHLLSVPGNFVRSAATDRDKVYITNGTTLTVSNN
jgi:hypothetical protein